MGDVPSRIVDRIVIEIKRQQQRALPVDPDPLGPDAVLHHASRAGYLARGGKEVDGEDGAGDLETHAPVSISYNACCGLDISRKRERD